MSAREYRRRVASRSAMRVPRGARLGDGLGRGTGVSAISGLLEAWLKRNRLSSQDPTAILRETRLGDWSLMPTATATSRRIAPIVARLPDQRARRRDRPLRLPSPAGGAHSHRHGAARAGLWLGVAGGALGAADRPAAAVGSRTGRVHGRVRRGSPYLRSQRRRARSAWVGVAPATARARGLDDRSGTPASAQRRRSLAALPGVRCLGTCRTGRRLRDGARVDRPRCLRHARPVGRRRLPPPPYSLHGLGQPHGGARARPRRGLIGDV